MPPALDVVRPVRPISPEDPLLARAAALRCRPGFPAALLRFTEAMIRFRIDGPPHFSKLLAHDTRYRIVVLICGLDTRARLAGGSGTTAPALLDALNRTLSGSRSVLRTTLRMMLKIGLLDERPDPDDRRSLIYSPTDALRAINRAWFAATFDSLDRVCPEARLPARLAADDRLLTRVNLNIGDALIVGETLTGRMPEFNCFFRREFGWPYLYLVVRDALTGAPAPSLNTVATTFGAPRAQIAAIRAEAHRLGYLAPIDARRMRATPRLLDHYEAWLAFFLAFALDLAERPNRAEPAETTPPA